MRFRRRRGFRPKWTWADSGNMVLNNGSPDVESVSLAFAWLLPPARVQFMLNTKGRSHMQYSGSHLWLDFQWHGTATNLSLPDVDFCVYKTQIADDAAGTPDFTPALNQWDQPSTPAALTSWDEDDDDGTTSFLWQHHIKGMTPPNAAVITYSESDAQSKTFNQHNVIAGSVDSQSFVCRKFFVTQEWQPDVVVRSKRRLQKSEGIVMVMSAAASSIVTGMEVQCDYHWRSLTK